MEFRVLGPVRATSGGHDVNLGGPRQRRLLAVLLIGDGRVVGLDRIVDAVWGEGEPPSGASRTVVSYISRLRSALGDGYVTTRDGGYVLTRGDAFVDEVRFAALVGVAADAQPERALALLGEGLGLWAGRAFGDLADEEWCRPTAVRLEEMRLVALEARVQARLELGAHAEAVPELEQLVTEHPFRERFRGQLMVALFRCGRQAEALRSFRGHRRLLAEETGLEPSRELVELERRIASSDPALQFATVGRTKRGYVLAEVIGEGASGTVYRAVQPSVGRDVAIKVVRPELADDPDYVRRFESEARLVARLEHPHIVPLYDFWREPGAAYLVLRLVRGGTVETARRATPRWPLARVTRLVEEIGAALAAAHDAGVVHRDVKPTNVLFDTAGNAYLADFGVATDVVESSCPPGPRSTGSALYASPEQVRDGVATASSDQYALAVMVWELLAGVAPFPGGQTTTSLHSGLTCAVPSLSDHRPELPDEIDGVLQRAAAIDPGGRYGSMAEFLLGWRAAVAGPYAVWTNDEPGAVTVRNPYKGLRAFDEADARDFEGRERAVERLAELVRHRRFVLVVGPSGCGKSSLLRAGLAPRLRAERQLVAVAVPGAHPVQEIVEALTQVAVERPVGLDDHLLDPAQLSGSIASLLPADGDLVLVLDQFEELWTLAEPEVRDRLLDALVAAAGAPHSRLRIVATVRADFYDRPLAHPTIGPLVEGSSFSVAPLGPAELERALTAPAARVGIRLEPALVAELVADTAAQPASLPLLQYALTELFDHRDGSTMTIAAYEAMGGLAGALTTRAEALHDAVPEVDRPAVRRLFTRLITTNDTRRRARRGELTTVPPGVIDAYGQARLLTFDVDPTTREPTVEVAHEALIRHWPRLRAWLDEDRDGLRIHRHLTEAAAAWTARGREPGDLYRGARLQTAAEWAGHHAADLSPDETTFLHDAQRRARTVRRRTIAAIGALGLLLVAALVATGLAVTQQRRADRNAVTAEQSATDSELRRLAFEAQATATSQPDLAMLLAVEAHRRQPGLASESALYASLLTQPAIRRYVDTTLPPGKAVHSMTASAQLLALELDGTVVLLDATTLRPTGVTITTGARNTLAFNMAGDELATSATTGEVRRWDPRSGREVAPVVHVRTLPGNSYAPPLGYLADGALVAADLEVIEIIPRGAGAQIRHVDVPGAPPVTSLAVSPTDETIAVGWIEGDGFGGGGIGLVDASSLTFRAVPWSLGTPFVLRFSDDGQLYVSTILADVTGNVVVVDTATASPTSPVVHVQAAASDLVTPRDGGALAALYTGGLVRVRPDMTPGPRIEVRGRVPLAQLTDGTVLAVTANRLVEIDPDDRGATTTVVRVGGRTAFGVLAGAAGRLLLLERSTMTVVDETTLAPVGPPLVTTRDVTTDAVVSMSADGKYVGVADGTGVEVIDVALGRATRPEFPIGTAEPAGFSPDGRLLLISDSDGTLHMIDLATDTERWSREFGPSVGGTSWSSDGRLLTATPFEQDPRILDAATGADVAGPFPGVSSVAFAPSGDTVLAIGDEVRILDAHTGSVLRTLRGLGGLAGGAFANDGRWITAVTGSGMDEIIDVESGQRIGVPLRVADDLATDPKIAVIVATGLYWGPLTGPVVYYDLDPTSWEATACRAAGRNLTRAEWDRYLGTLGDYRPTCPQYPAAA